MVVDKRQRMCDYEGDTAVGKGHKGVLVTLIDLATKETKIRALKNRRAQRVSNACIGMLSTEKPLSFDNGKEFFHHEKIAAELNTAIYFAKPSHSWERGTKDNTNGLIGQFSPKSMPFDKISNEETQTIEDKLNNRPRKIQVYQTLLEVKSRFSCVALRY